jgi:hypothetical protein
MALPPDTPLPLTKQRICQFRPESAACCHLLHLFLLSRTICHVAEAEADSLSTSTCQRNMKFSVTL